MTKAGEQPTIMLEDRKAYAALYLKDQGEPHSVHDLSVVAEIEMGLHDDWDGVQAFAAHRNLHESTPENNKAGGLWYRRWFALANTRTTSLAAQGGLVDALEKVRKCALVVPSIFPDTPPSVSWIVSELTKILPEMDAALSAIKGDKS